MEKRKIIVVSSATQSQAAFESDATTLGELKRELNTRGIDYTGMTFLEGHSKLEMNLDEAVLPTNIPYKGTTTNDLVFLLTSPQKKIKSGASRIEIYGFIRDNDLADLIKKHFGKNFTNISTENLLEFLKSLTDESKKEESKEEKQCSCCGNSSSTSTSWDDYDEEDDEDEDDDEENEDDDTSYVDSMIDGLKHIVYGMVKLGYINPVEITKPDEHKILSDEKMNELFGDFFSE